MSAPKSMPKAKAPVKEGVKAQRGMPTKERPKTSTQQVMRKKG